MNLSVIGVRKHVWAMLSMIWLIQWLAGCSSIGPSSIRANRTDYNMAIQGTNDQELLLNIVRSRYRDNFYFTTVERVVAAQKMGRTASANLWADWIGNYSPYNRVVTEALRHTTRKTLGLAPTGISLSEEPTVFYVPIEGEQFVRQMLTPMRLSTLLLLIRSGWSIDRVFMVAVQEMNGLPNAPSASRPTPPLAPEFRAFREAVGLMRAMQRTNDSDIGLCADHKTMAFRFLHGSGKSEQALRLKQLLKLDPDIDCINIVGEMPTHDNHTIVITTRTVMGSLNLLSQSVEVPNADIAAGKVRQTVEKDRVTPFNWQALLDGVFKVRKSSTPPDAASVAIHYRNTWFYIADNDLDSKSTFLLMAQLIALHSVPPKSDPVVSYPVR